MRSTTCSNNFYNSSAATPQYAYHGSKMPEYSEGSAASESDVLGTTLNHSMKKDQKKVFASSTLTYKQQTNASYQRPLYDLSTATTSWEDASPKKNLKKIQNLSRLFVFFQNFQWLNRKIFKNNKKEFVGWILLIMLILVCYKFFSDGSFSAILTLASGFHFFSMVLLNLKVISQQSTSGISRRSVGLIIICMVFRLMSTLFFNGYLPVDRSGDWLYQGADILSAFLGVLLLSYSHYYCTTSMQMQESKDTCYILLPMLAAAILALIVHPNLNHHFIADTCWTFALYLETYSMVPQLFMMVKLGGEVEALTSHYVASMAASKIFSVLFWYFSYSELTPRRGGLNIAGWAVMLSYSIQALLFADFLYYYIKSLRVGRKMIINF